MDLTRLLRNQWDRTLAIVLAALGLLAIFLGWRGVADAVLPSQQIPYLASGGLIGVFLLGSGATIWLSSDLRDEWRRIDDLLEAVNELRSEELPSDVPADVAGANGHGADTTDPTIRRRRSPIRAEHASGN